MQSLIFVFVRESYLVCVTILGYVIVVLHYLCILPICLWNFIFAIVYGVYEGRTLLNHVNLLVFSLCVCV